ncbi:caspase recruitment domain-containing protein 9 isoform X5 [Oenanthe melanoleuca]|uniref:caspase recruitment domain-containing protein 9 isoform X5 n=1 Tax=Oenanthe melanoleuca TaxID=2939378 RepID=UPI0024C1F90B|nr:caspase recruitment domain-containing protein 9 isoform X5 [Oenanthe melanoleuca]
MLDLMSVWSDRTGISHAGRWRRRSELLIKQRQQLIKTLLHSQSVTSLVSPPLPHSSERLRGCLFVCLFVLFQTGQRCSLFPLTAAMLEEDNDEMCWNNLENFRVQLVSVVDPSRITPYLRQCKVLSPDDEEQVLNDPSLVMRKRKAGVLLDILQRTGHKGFEAFMESLELYYPQLYKKITGKEPSRVFSMIIDTAGESGLSQVLMNEIMKLQSAVQEERRKAQELAGWLHSKEDTLREMWVRDSLLRKHQERAQRMKEERDSLSKELRKCKDENYSLALSYAKQSEEKSAALMKNRDLLLEIDQLKHSLMKAEDDCKLERKHTMKLKHAIEQRPSHEVVWEIQQEKELLLAKNQELENTLQVAREQNLEKSLSKEALENDCSQTVEERRELLNTIYSLRKELHRAKVLQDKQFAEEKEVLELQCTSLRKDSQMYKKRIEAVLQQMEEVASERDQTSDLDDTSSRDSQELVLHSHLDKDTQTTKKDCLEVQNKELSPRGSHLPPKSPSECGLANEELAEKERRRMKDCFERYRRSGLQKRAMRRAPKDRHHEVDWENSSGSDNTDTEGS